MGFKRTSVVNDEKRENVVCLELSGEPQEIFSAEYVDFAKHCCVGLLAREADSGNDPDNLFAEIEKSITQPAKYAADVLCQRILKNLVQDPAGARKICEHYKRTGEIMEGVELL